MARSDYESLLSALGERPGGVFFVFGEEAFMREEALARIVDAHIDGATRDFNLDVMRGDEVTAEALASVLQTPPMMAEWRVVVLRDAQHLSQKARDVVESVAASPPPGLAFAIAAVIPSGSKAKFYSSLQRTARAVEVRRVEVMDAPGWLMERARVRHSIDLQPEAARYLVTAVGTDLRTLSSELEKLEAYVSPRTEATGADVEAVTGRIARADRWGWFDLVAERNIPEALRQLPTLIEGSESGVGLVIGLTGHFLKIGLVCAGGASALDRELKPYQRWLSRRLVPQAKRWTLAEVDAALSELLRTDRLLKSASLTDRQAMEELLLRLGSLRKPAEVAA